jgi:hypothetical protein
VRGIGGEISIVEVNHRPRAGGASKYNAWNRAWAGIIDLLGVMWLLHRTRYPVIARIVASDDESAAPGSVTETP